MLMNAFGITLPTDTPAEYQTVSDFMQALTGYDGWDPQYGAHDATHAMCTLPKDSMLIYPTLCALSKISQSLGMRYFQSDDGMLVMPERYILVTMDASNIARSYCYLDARADKVVFEVDGFNVHYQRVMVPNFEGMKTAYEDGKRMATHLPFGSEAMTRSIQSRVDEGYRECEARHPELMFHPI